MVTYTGANEHSGQKRPPAVPLGELLDVLDRTTGVEVRDRIVVEHLFSRSTSRTSRPAGWGCRPLHVRPGHARRRRDGDRERPPAPDFLPSPLPPAPQEDVALADLLAFFRDPVKGFFRALDLTLPWDVEGVSDQMPVEIDALETWGVGDRMLADMLRGLHPERPSPPSGAAGRCRRASSGGARPTRSATRRCSWRSPR